MTKVIGLDFDNTIACYDSLFHELAVQRGLIRPCVRRLKRCVRDAVRLRHTDREWQRLQAEAYGRSISGAQLTHGLPAFLDTCRLYEARLFVVSHKTRYADCDATKTDLRSAALGWIEASGLLGLSDGVLHRDSVFFEDTRAAKVDRISQLECTHHVDDLVEVFIEPRFPSSTRQILYLPSGDQAPDGPWRVVRDWKDASRLVFND